METATYLLFLLGCLGAADIILFHSTAHGIRAHPDSLSELVTHSLRGPTYATLFVVIPNFMIQGLFAWALLALFVFDVGISIWDFSLEQTSRRLLGGVPSAEYVLHMLMAMLFGAMVTSVFYCAGDLLNEPTGLRYVPTGVPGILRFTMLIMATLVLFSGVQDALAAFRLRRLQFQTGRRPRPRALSIIQHLNPVMRNQPSPVQLGGWDAPESRAPWWMQGVLVAAGIYNLLWGAWIVLSPDSLFKWAAIPAVNYPQIWQCVGMIVGVYGIGYVCAARDPFRHWPIVLVGLLGKVLGPAGMFWSVARGSLPISLEWTCVTNDLVWWVPFGLILYRAFTNQRAFADPKPAK